MNQPDKIGRYKLEEELEVAGLGQFWRGTDILTGETVLVQAIPFPRLGEPKSRSELFRRLTEAQRQHAELAHRHLRRVLGVSRTADVLYLFHDWRVGPSLASLAAAQSRPLGPGRIALVLNEAAQALEHAHQQGLIYGRLSALSIGLDDRGAYLQDFGLAPLLLEATEQRGGTLSHAQFLAPEQVSGKRPDALTDGYALAVLAYSLLTGAYPYSGETQEELLDNILYREPMPPESLEPGLHPNISRVLLKGLSKEPENRFQSPTLFTASLAKTLVREEPEPAPSVPRPVAPHETAAPRMSRSRRLADVARRGSRRLLGLGEGESLGRTETMLLVAAGLAVLVLVLGVLLYLVRPMGRVRDRLQSGQLQEAESLLERLGERWAEDPDRSLLGAELAFRLKREEEAVAQFWQVLAVEPELLREARVEPLLVKLFLRRPGDPRAVQLGCRALEWVKWPELAADLGLGAPERAAGLLQLLVLCGREQEAQALASSLALRLRQRPSAALGLALMPLVARVRSVELGQALGALLLRQSQIGAGVEVLRLAFTLGEARAAVQSSAQDLFEALERDPQSPELRALLVEQAAWLEPGLRMRLEHPDPIVRLATLRALEEAGAEVQVPVEQRLEWQLAEAEAHGSSPGLEPLIADVAKQAHPAPRLVLLLARHDLLRGDLPRGLDRLGNLLRRSPELGRDPEVAGMLLGLLGQGADPEAWLQRLDAAFAGELLELAALAPSPALRERAVRLLARLGRDQSTTARLIVELRDPRTADRIGVAEKLALRPEPEAAAALAAFAAESREPWLAQRIAQLLAGPAGDKSREPLLVPEN
jgi:hypothetical protein